MQSEVLVPTVCLCCPPAVTAARNIPAGLPLTHRPCRPLSLHAERLRHLVQLWRSSALDYDSHVLHAANHRNEPASVY